MTAYEKRKHNEFAQSEDLPKLAKSKGLTEEEAATWLWVRWKCLTDLYFLGAEILELDKAVLKVLGRKNRKRLDPKLHKELAAQLESGEDSLLLYPRLHMKTTWVKNRIVQLILQNPNTRVGLWSRTSGLVEKELESIRRHLQKPVLVELFPEILNVPLQKWARSTKAELTIRRDPELGEPPQENQVEAWGITSTVVGHHYDYLFYDDIIDQQSIRTPALIEKVTDWWQHQQAIREPTAVEVMTGTRYHHTDIYGQIIEEKHFPNIVQRAAIENGKPIYSFFSQKDLDRLRRRMGEYNFACQMMNDAVPRGDRIFVPPYPIWEKLPDTPKWYLTFDPGLGSTHKYSTGTGFCAACVDAQKPTHVFFKEATRLMHPADKLAAFIVEKCVQYSPWRVGIEFGMQEGLKYLIDVKIEEWEKTHKAKFLRPQFMSIPVGKMEKAQRINNTIGAFVRDERALFAKDQRILFSQMDFFNPHSLDNDDDVIDAASMIIRVIEHFAQSHWESIGTPERVGMTWAEFIHPPQPAGAWGSEFKW